MCGIIGKYSSGSQLSHSHFENARDYFKYRGPDDYGESYFLNSHLALGHRRLSIIDLSKKGHQPMFTVNGELSIVFNGEIYNFIELREQLIQKGHVFQSNTDTEVLILGYTEWGMERLLDRIKGMFAFVIYDAKRQVLTGARDRFGMKPMYYFHHAKEFAFSSDFGGLIKLFPDKKNISEEGLINFLVYGHIPQSQTIIEGVRKLPPGHAFEYNLVEDTLDVYRFWQLTLNNHVVPFDEAYENFHDLIDTSVEEHLTSDVPVGIFLSGGYDSTTLLDYMSRKAESISTYSVGFEGSSRSEHETARGISKIYNTVHNEVLISPEMDFMALLEQISEYFPEPYAASSMIPYWFVSKLAAEHVKVVLSGDGGDELFAGYKWHYHMENINRNPLAKALRVAKNGGYKNYLAKHYASYMEALRPEQHRFFEQGIKSRLSERSYELYKDNFKRTGHIVKDIQWLDVQTFIPEPILTRADRMSMAHSLEVRLPFLDHKLFEYGYSLNPTVYWQRGTKKPILEEYLKKTDASHVVNLPKRGFSFHFLDKLRTPQVESFQREVLIDKHQVLNNAFDPAGLDKSTNFKLLMLAFWFDRHYDN